jgi:hypothetical protein
MKNAVYWDVTACGSCKNRRFKGVYRFHHQFVFVRSVLWLLVTARFLILSTLMMEAIRSSILSPVSDQCRESDQ